MLTLAIICKDLQQYLYSLGKSLEDISKCVDEILIITTQGHENKFFEQINVETKCILCEDNAGLPEFYNKALKNAKNDWMLFCRADVEFTHGFFEKLAGLQLHEDKIYLPTQIYTDAASTSCVGWDYLENNLFYHTDSVTNRHIGMPSICKITEGAFVANKNKVEFDIGFKSVLFDHAAVLSSGLVLEKLEGCSIYFRNMLLYDSMLSVRQDTEYFRKKYPLLVNKCRDLSSAAAALEIKRLREKTGELQVELNNKVGHVELLLETERTLSRQRADLDNQIDEKNRTIDERNRTVDERNRTVDERNRTVDERNSTIDQINSLLCEKDKAIDALHCKAQEMLEEAELNTQLLEDKNNDIFNKTNRINELESWAELYRQQIAALETIRSSRTWRYAHKLTSIVRKIIPANTYRARLAGALGRFALNILHIPRKIKAFFFNGQESSNVNRFRKITVKTDINPLVSIIIPVYNQFSYTYSCLEAISRECVGIKYEIIIADDNSDDLTKKISKKVRGIRVIRNSENLRFLRNCNNATKSARGKYILFLNNDTKVQKNWLQSLIARIEGDATIGMVGSKIIYPDGRLQEAGGILWENGNAWNYGQLQNPDNSEFNYVKDVDYISGCSLMIKHDLWKQIGGFDERFAPAYCEDSDLAFEVRRHGKRVVYEPLSVVVHYEGISNGTDLSSGQKQYQAINSKKFFEKWKSVLQSEHYADGHNVFNARDRSGGKPCILFIDHYVPTFDQDAGSRTVYEYIKLFVNMGYNVKFIPDNFNRTEKYTEALQQMGIEVLYGPDYAQNWKLWIAENSKNISYVFTNRPHISVKYMDFLRENTKARIIYYGHDLHFLREQREYELTKNKELLASVEKWKKTELSIMRKADMAYYPSKIEEDFIHSIDKKIRVKAIPAYIFAPFETPIFDIAKRKDILFVGGFAHTPNVDAIVWFADKVLPIIQKANTDIHFHIVGSHPTQAIKELQNESITVHGFVSDEELADFYAKCRLVVVPLRYGAGIKGKVIEAMKFGIPIVTTSIGAEGILGAENILAIEDKPAAFAQQVVALYEDADKLGKMCTDGCEYVRQQYSPQNAIDTIKGDFT